MNSYDRNEVLNALRQKVGYEFKEEELPPIIRSKIGKLTDKWNYIKSLKYEYDDYVYKLNNNKYLYKMEIILLIITMIFTIYIGYFSLLIYLFFSFIFGILNNKVIYYSLLIMFLMIVFYFILNIYSIYIVSIIFIIIFIFLYKRRKLDYYKLNDLSQKIKDEEKEFSIQFNEISDEILKTHEYVFESKLDTKIIDYENMPKSITIKCLSCGAPLTFNPKDYKWEKGYVVIECPYCGTKNLVNKDALK
ncbi:MAG: hypothetical protein ACP5LM_03075 [Thermoplasmata archaeon]